MTTNSRQLRKAVREASAEAPTPAAGDPDAATLANTTEGAAEPSTAPADGRQSEAALAIARGTMRLMASHGLTCLAELTLANWRRADLIALSDKGSITIVEVKSSVTDFRTDQKWPEYLDFCDAFYFAVAPDFPLDLIPPSAGLIVADRYGGEFVRDGARNPLPAARRKAITIRIARAAQARLQRLADPEGAYERFTGE